MATVKKYNYVDWWDGKICLIYATIVYNEKNKKDIPPHVTWDRIKKPDVLKIKEKQKNIFHTAVTKLLKTWKEDFTKRYTNSKATTLLLNRELLKFEDIMYGQIPSSSNALLSYREILIPVHSLAEIKNFINDAKVNGVEPEFDFIHSPNYKFQTTKQIPPEVYAECCWLYVKWLEKHLKPRKRESRTQDPALTKPAAVETNKAQITDEKLPPNPHPDIFKNGYAFNMFLELQDLTVTNKTKVADYSFIFQKMHDPKFKAIKKSVNHSEFIDFLNKNYDAEIEVNKLPFRNPTRKQVTYNSIFKKYQNDILNE